MKMIIPHSDRVGTATGAMTVVLCCAETPVGSSVLVAVALFVIVAAAPEPTETTIVIVAEAPGLIVPRLQVTVCATLIQPVPCVAEAVKNVPPTPAGRVSTTWTFVASDGPLFETKIV